MWTEIIPQAGRDPLQGTQVAAARELGHQRGTGVCSCQCSLSQRNCRTNVRRE